MSPDLEVLAEYTILDATNQSSITKRISAFPSRLSVFGIASKKPNPKTLMVTVKFLDPGQVSRSETDRKQSNALNVVDCKQFFGNLCSGSENSRGDSRPAG